MGCICIDLGWPVIAIVVGIVLIGCVGQICRVHYLLTKIKDTPSPLTIHGLKRMLADGQISQEEFEAAKKRLIAEARSKVNQASPRERGEQRM